MPKSPYRHLNKFDVRIYADNFMDKNLPHRQFGTPCPVTFELGEDEWTGETYVLASHRGAPPDRIPVAGIFHHVCDRKYNYLRQAMDGPDVDQENLYLAASLLIVVAELRRQRRVRTLPPQYLGWHRVRLFRVLLDAIKDALRSRATHCEAYRIEGRETLLLYQDEHRRPTLVPVDPRPGGHTNKAVEKVMGAPILDWALSLAPREAWAGTRSDVGSCDQAVLETVVLHLCCALREVVQLLTLFGVALRDRDPVWDE